MQPDTDPGAGHLADAAASALGTLDLDDAMAFQEHLPGCPQCQEAVTDFRRVASVLRWPARQIELPPDLEDRTISAVLRAAATAGRLPGKAGQLRRQEARKAVRWPLGDWRARLLTAGVAVAAAAIAVAVAVPLSRDRADTPGPVAGEFSLRPVTSTVTAGGTATVYRESAGFKIVLRLRGLPATAAGQYYECWYVGPRSPAGQRVLITAGSFTVGSSGVADATMWSAANPATFRTMEITIDAAAGASPGSQVLVGHAAS